MTFYHLYLHIKMGESGGGDATWVAEIPSEPRLTPRCKVDFLVVDTIEWESVGKGKRRRRARGDGRKGGGAELDGGQRGRVGRR